jgi:6-phosphofructokinase 2
VVDLVRSGKVDIVALTLGELGALLVGRDFRLRARGLGVKAASAVGAGDSFLGAMVWRLSLGGEWEEAFRYGVAGGAAALLSPGTELCRKEDVERLCRQVSIQHI